MKKGGQYEGIIERIDFPNKGILWVEEEKETPEGTEKTREKVIVKNGIPGQKVRVVITKRRKGKSEGTILEVLSPSPLETAKDPCCHFGTCGGCLYQTIPYEEQLNIKEGQVKSLLDAVVEDGSYEFQGIKASPIVQGYRNKMEFSFGDEYKDGPLCLGMHKRGSFYDVVNADGCKIVHDDFSQILTATREFFKERGVPFYRKLAHQGYLRHLLVRRAVKTGEILVDLVTTTQKEALPEGIDEEELLNGWKDGILALLLEGSLAGILHTKTTAWQTWSRMTAQTCFMERNIFTKNFWV